MKTWLIHGYLLFITISFCHAQGDTLLEKTLIVWASVSDLDQSAGSALTLENGSDNFDGIVYGEISPNRWMAGSDNFHRTHQEQDSYKTESILNEIVQIAIVYHPNTVTIYRNGEILDAYEITKLVRYTGMNSFVLMGKRHLNAGNPQHSFEGIIHEARIYSKPLSTEEIRSLVPGKTNPNELWAWWDFSRGIQELTGRFNFFELLEGARHTNGKLFLPGKGATFLARQSADSFSWKKTSPVPKTIIKQTRAFRERLLADPYRPAYHFAIPEDQGSPGDPNGAFYHNGKYHLMYLYNREGSGFSWGHISSSDLIHWRHHPDAIGPGDGDEGCFSGGAFLDDDGTAYLSYWMLWGARGIGLARSTDPQMNHWEKISANPVIKSTDWGVTEMKNAAGETIWVGSADPSNIWKKEGKYYMLTGNLLVLNKLGREETSPETEQGDRLYLFSSTDLQNWQYEHRFYESDRKWTRASEDNMCPSFFPLPLSPEGGEFSDKHLLLFISHNLGCQYYIGTYENDHFTPENHGRMTWVDNRYFAPEALVDDKGRHIMWAWIFDDRPSEYKARYGWTGTYGLPRTLWLGEDGTLRMKPVSELNRLRMNEKVQEGISLDQGKSADISELGRELMEVEITAKITPGAAFTVALGIDQDRTEETLITYDDEDKTLSVDTRKSGLNFGEKVVEKAHFQLKKGEPLKLRVFVDRSVIEVYANDRQAIARRVYPTRNGTGILLKAQKGPVDITKIVSWEMSPSNSY